MWWTWKRGPAIEEEQRAQASAARQHLEKGDEESHLTEGSGLDFGAVPGWGQSTAAAGRPSHMANRRRQQGEL